MIKIKPQTFDFTRCIKGDLQTSDEIGKCYGWTIYDQLDYVGSLVDINERYLKFSKEKFQKAVDVNIHELLGKEEVNKAIRKRMKICLIPDHHILGTIFRYHKEKNLAFKKATCETAAWNMDQLFSQLRHQYDSLHFDRTQKELMSKRVEEELEQTKILLKGTTPPRWETELQEQIITNENTLQKLLLREDALWYINRQYDAIKKQLFDDINDVNKVLLNLGKHLRGQMNDLNDIKRICSEAEFGRAEVKEHIAVVESQLYQSALQQERELAIVQQEYAEIKSENLDKKKNYTSESSISTYSLKEQQSMDVMREIADMYETCLSDLREITDVRKVEDIEESIIAQNVMKKSFLIKKKELISRFKDLIHQRCIIQEAYMILKDKSEWRGICNTQIVADLEKELAEEHCEGHKVQNSINYLGHKIIESRQGIVNLHKILYEDEDPSRKYEEREMADSWMLQAIKTKLAKLIQNLKSLEFDCDKHIRFKAYTKFAQHNNPPENLKIKFPKVEEIAFQQLVYFDEEENDENAPSREMVKKQSAELVELSVKKLSQQKQQGMFAM